MFDEEEKVTTRVHAFCVLTHKDKKNRVSEIYGSLVF